METIIHFFTNIPSSYRSGLLVGGLVLCWGLEGLLPLRALAYRKWRHAGLNLFFTLTTILVNLAFAGLILAASQWAVAQRWGLLPWLADSWAAPVWLGALVGLLGLDLMGAYLAHWVQHQVKWLWQFHLIHHTDPYVDATTANRHHPGESVLRAGFTGLAVLVLGAPMWLVMFYQSLSVLASQFNHANIGLPAWLDRGLGWVIVSPNMHKVHHHLAQPLTDTNYGNIFSVWDRLFGTFATTSPEQISYGVDTHPAPEETTHLGRLLRLPFAPYRPPKGRK
ncbi:MAG: sterol desaturase family protein [Bernardetiaceae bacterium]|nr:sterol desaturase family protein [Bernardetiaceae bacterium]